MTNLDDFIDSKCGSQTASWSQQEILKYNHITVIRSWNLMLRALRCAWHPII